jgi:hypothetical protein
MASVQWNCGELVPIQLSHWYEHLPPDPIHGIKSAAAIIQSLFDSGSMNLIPPMTAANHIAPVDTVPPFLRGWHP